MRTPSYVVGIVQSGKGLSFAAKCYGACAVVACVEVFAVGLCGLNHPEVFQLMREQFLCGYDGDKTLLFFSFQVVRAVLDWISRR